MKKILLLIVICFSINSFSQSITITQNNDPNTVNDSAVACTVGAGQVDEDEGLFEGMYFDNYFARSFDLQNDHNINTDFTITSIEVGQGFGRNTQIEVRIYTANTIDLTSTDLELNLLETEDIFIIEQGNDTVLFIPTNINVPAGEIVVIEIFVPDSGTATNEEFFVGINNAGQTAPTYIKAPDCSVNNYMLSSGLGLGEQAYIINIVGQENLSINQTELDKIEVYPNPVVDIVNLELPAGMILEKASLVDMSGKLSVIEFTDGIYNSSDLAAGQYILNLETSSGVYTHKLLKK